MTEKNQSESEKDGALRLDAFLPYRLSFTSNLVSETIAQTYRSDFGLTIPEWRLVAVIAEAEQGMTQREIGDRTHMDKVTVSRAAKALVGRSLLERQMREEDRRSHALMLTGEGRALYARIAPTARRIEAAIFGRFDPQELHQLNDLLRRIDQATREMEGQRETEA